MSVHHPQLASVIGQLADASAHAVRAGACDERTFQQRPQPDSWSAAECLGHLNLATVAFLPLFDAALAGSDRRPVAEDHRYRRDFAGWLLTRILEPPFRLKVKTTTPFVPVAVGTREEVLREFAGLQDALTARVAACEGRDLERRRVVSPFNARVKYNLYSCMTILTAHQRRHLWQADRALERVRS